MGMMGILFSLLYWIFVGSTAVVLYVGAVILWLVTKPFDPGRVVLHRYTCWWGRLYLRCLPGCRFQVEGRDRIVPGTPYVLVANHQSSTDIMALSALAVPFKWVSKKEAFRIPCIGWNMYLNQYVSVDRGNLRSVRQTMAECRGWLERGIPLLMFPEGHRSETGEMQDFHNGSFKLAADFGCAVVPIVVDGTWGIYRRGRVTAFPGVIRIHVLDPIRIEQTGGKVDSLRDIVHRQMKEELAAMRGLAANLEQSPKPRSLEAKP
jgi:1-acyl-sn-glycerol-3-phosphate acyltransferase